MVGDNAGGTATPAPSVDNSPSLSAFVGEMFGDYRDVEPDETEGATPAVEAEAKTEPAEPEGATNAEPAA